MWIFYISYFPNPDFILIFILICLPKLILFINSFSKNQLSDFWLIIFSFSTSFVLFLVLYLYLNLLFPLPNYLSRVNYGSIIYTKIQKIIKHEDPKVKGKHFIRPLGFHKISPVFKPTQTPELWELPKRDVELLPLKQENKVNRMLAVQRSGTEIRPKRIGVWVQVCMSYCSFF